MIYRVLDYFFFFFHTLWVLFNISGWIFPKTRKWNLLTLLLTAFSWFVLGIWYGWGFCVCTEWHYMVRHQLGYYDMTDSYIHFLLLELTGINFPLQLTGIVTVIVFFICLALSLWLNIKDWKKRKI